MDLNIPVEYFFIQSSRLACKVGSVLVAEKEMCQLGKLSRFVDPAKTEPEPESELLWKVLESLARLCYGITELARAGGADQRRGFCRENHAQSILTGGAWGDADGRADP